MSNITSEILARFFEGRTTSEENNAIADWIESDPANQETFNRELQFHLMLMQMPASVQTPLQKPHRTRLALYAGLAASFVAGIILCWFLAVAPLSDEASRMVAFHTDPGQRASLTLPDGTSVELNSGSTLEYPAVFARGERRVRVEGEAMFDVAKVADKPFYVETFAYDVKVLGTRFNVESDEDRGVFSTALMEGSVAILDKHDNRITELEPDQVVTLTDGRLIKRHEENIGSRYRWTDGIINCSGLSFEELMRRFERAFGVTIVIECEAVPDISYKRMKVNVCDGISHA
ncbi:MAG: FecR domain-containing protein, partial [Bacteroidales bacterium]|nr:FecR domain-containing protein [Bacteroidales bacterium]